MTTHTGTVRMAKAVAAPGANLATDPNLCRDRRCGGRVTGAGLAAQGNGVGDALGGPTRTAGSRTGAPGRPAGTAAGRRRRPPHRHHQARARQRSGGRRRPQAALLQHGHAADPDLRPAADFTNMPNIRTTPGVSPVPLSGQFVVAVRKAPPRPTWRRTRNRGVEWVGHLRSAGAGSGPRPARRPSAASSSSTSRIATATGRT